MQPGWPYWPGGFFLKGVILQSTEKLIYGDGKGISYSLLYEVVVDSK